MIKLLPLLFMSLILNSLNAYSQEIEVPEKLKENMSVFNVKGRQGIQVNQVITFGDFHTSKIKKGWIKTTTIKDANTSYKSGEQKFSFVQYAPTGLQAVVNCEGKLSSLSIEVVRGFFEIGTDFKNVFSGSIETHTDSFPWHFYVNDPDNMPDKEGNTSGAIIHGDETPILLNSVSKLEGKKLPKIMLSKTNGFVFTRNGEPLAAVSVYNKGVVMLGNDLPEELRLVLASISTALLVRQDLSE